MRGDSQDVYQNSITHVECSWRGLSCNIRTCHQGEIGHVQTCGPIRDMSETRASRILKILPSARLELMLSARGSTRMYHCTISPLFVGTFRANRHDQAQAVHTLLML